MTLKDAQDLAGTHFEEGEQHLNGEQALAYARERCSLPRGDFDRVNRQQGWMRAIVTQVFHNGTLTDPIALYHFPKVAASSTAVDGGFGLGEMRDLAVSLRGLRAPGTTFMTVPTSGLGTSPDGQSIVLLDPAADQPLFKAFQTDTVAAYLKGNPDAVLLLPTTVN